MNRCDGLEAIGASRLEEGGRTAPRPYAKPGAAMRLPKRKEVGAVAAGLEVAPCDPPCAQPRVPLRPQRLKEATTTQLARLAQRGATEGGDVRRLVGVSAAGREREDGVRANEPK